MRQFLVGLAAGSLLLVSTGCVVDFANTPTVPSEPASNVAQKVSIFDGSWDTNFGLLTLISNGNRVTGTYGKQGKVAGTLSADEERLVATWTEDGASGTVTFTVSDDGNTITGIWTEDGVSGKRKDWTGGRLQEAQRE